MRLLPILTVLASSLACASAPPRMAQQASPPPTGQVSYRLVEDPAGQPSSDAVAKRHQELVPPTANPRNTPPPYPHEAIEKACQDTTVVVRLIIDVQGNVAEIRDSPFGGSATSPCSPLFRRATEAAVGAWTFAPAFRQTQTQPATAGAFGQPRWESETIPWYADFAFKFQIVAGKGVVTVPR